MLNRIRTRRRDESGFTLIELLITIVILGVLAAIVVFGVQAFNSNGQAAACQADKKNVQVAVQAYYAKNAAWPTAIGDLVTGGYLQSAPPTTNGYTITLGSNGSVTASGACT
jgi:general secretion pathway protein G